MPTFVTSDAEGGTSGISLWLLGSTRARVTSDGGITKLADHPRLYKLDLSGDGLNEESVSHLNAMPHLRALRLKDFNNNHLSQLVGMKDLDALLLRGATDQSLPAILQLSQLQYLTLEDSQLSTKSTETIRKTFSKLRIKEEMSDERLLELGIPQKLAAERRLKRTIFIAVALGGGCLVLFLVMLWQRRESRRHQMSKG